MPFLFWKRPATARSTQTMHLRRMQQWLQVATWMLLGTALVLLLAQFFFSTH